MEKKQEDEFVWTAENAPRLIINDRLQCKDCIYRTDPEVIECVKYISKPRYVLMEEKPCEYYEKKADKA